MTLLTVFQLNLEAVEAPQPTPTPTPSAPGTVGLPTRLVMLPRRQPVVLTGAAVAVLPTLRGRLNPAEIIAPLAATAAVPVTARITEPARIPQAFAELLRLRSLRGGAISADLSGAVMGPLPGGTIGGDATWIADIAARQTIDHQLLRIRRVAVQTPVTAMMGLRAYQTVIRADERDRVEEALALLVLTGERGPL